MIFLFVILGIVSVGMPDVAKIAQQYGISVMNWLILFFGVLPILMMLLIFFKGYWRLALILLFTAFSVAALHMNAEPTAIPVDQRLIRFEYFFDGSDIYCNGIHLGTAPLTISVGELKAKVPAWTEPPEQTWFVDGPRPLYTWFPWDDFIRERSEERYFLDPKQSTLAFDAKSSYWWRFEYQGAKAICFSRQQGTTNFDRMSAYSFGAFAQIVFPSRWARADLLRGVLEADGGKPSQEWIEQVATYPNHFNEVLYGTRTGEPLDDAVLTSIAKRRYGLSETPTAEECDKAIGQIVEESGNVNFYQLFARPQQLDESDSSYAYSVGYLNANHFGRSYDLRDIIAKHAIRAMGPACKEPLLRRFRTINNDDLINGMWRVAAILYIMGEYCFPEAFEEVFCRYAVERNGFRELMKYPDERLIPFLETLLAPEIDIFQSDYYGHTKFQKASAVVSIENKLLEPTIRAYLAEMLPRCEHQSVSLLLFAYADMRMNFDWTDRKEIAEWIESLRVEGRHKTFALQKLRTLPEEEKTLGQSVVSDGLLTQKLTEASLLEWIERNPDRMIEDLLVELDPALLDEAETLKPFVLEKVIRRNKPEAGKIIRLLWKQSENRDEILKAVQEVSGSITVTTFDADGNPRERRVRLPGTYTSLNLADGGFQSIKPKERLPEYFVALFDELDDPRTCVPLPSLLSDVETPEALALLTRWSASDSSLLARRASESLEHLSLRMKLKDDRRRLFNDLVAGKITPDDLLLPTKPLVWDGERYVGNPAE